MFSLGNSAEGVNSVKELRTELRNYELSSHIKLIMADCPPGPLSFRLAGGYGVLISWKKKLSGANTWASWKNLPS